MNIWTLNGMVWAFAAGLLLGIHPLEADTSRAAAEPAERQATDERYETAAQIVIAADALERAANR
jgi:hypothetical protein